MATTRRQSARLAQKVPGAGAREQPLVIDSSEAEDEGFFSDESQETEDPEPRRARRKRPRTATNNGTPRRARAAEPADGSRRIVGRFNFLELGDDIRDMILVFLEPRDLLRLSWTSSSMAKTLMSRKAAHIWAAARKNTVLPGDISIPDCPDDISELRWAHLLFGPAQCFTCGAPNITTIIFPFRRRACVTCMKSNMLFEKKFDTVFGRAHAAILKFLPHSDTGPWAHGHPSGNKFYWTPDIEKAIDRHIDLEVDVEAGEPNAVVNLKRWKADRLLEVDTIMEESREHERWICRRETARDKAGDDTRLKRIQLVEAKLLDEGWEMVDIKKLAYVPKTIPAKPELAASAWTRIRKDVEPALLAVRSRRLFEEKVVSLGWDKGDVQYYSFKPHYEGDTITPEEWAETWTAVGPHFLKLRSQRLLEDKLTGVGWDRHDIMSIAYFPLYAGPQITDEEWKKTWAKIARDVRKLNTESLRFKMQVVYGRYCDSLPPSRWRTLPTVEEVSTFPEILSIISDREEGWRPLQTEELSTVPEQLPQLIDRWLANAKSRLASRLSLPSVDQHGQMVWYAAQPEHLDLAVAVFTCTTRWGMCTTVAQRVGKVHVNPMSIPFVGLEEALGHERLHMGVYRAKLDHCNLRPQANLLFSRRGSIAALALLQCLSMDPQKASPRDVDERDARFRCAHCAALHPQTFGRVVMDWRRAIAHFAASAERDHRKPSWILLTPEETESARDHVRRGACGGRNQHQWVCNLCDFKHQHMEAILLHMTERHESRASENVDFMSVSSCLRPVGPVTLSEPPPPPLPVAPDPQDTSSPPLPAVPAKAKQIYYWCNHCRGSRRDFKLQGIKDHIKVKHKIPKPQNGKDYRHKSGAGSSISIDAKPSVPAQTGEQDSPLAL